jgi:hypothetical protein
VILRRKQAVFASVPGSPADGLCQLIHAWATMRGIALEPGGLWTAR